MVGTRRNSDAWRPWRVGSAVGPSPADVGPIQQASSPLDAALLLLLESSAQAFALGEDPWEFSVEWPELQRLGLNCNDGRWLIYKRLVRHAREVTAADDLRRRFVSISNLEFVGADVSGAYGIRVRACPPAIRIA